MRLFIYIAGLLMVVVAGYWSHHETYATRASADRVSELHKEIAKQQEALTILESEWAYLNRPDRLQNLVELNFDRIELVPLAAPHFAKVGDLQNTTASDFDHADLGQTQQVDQHLKP